MSENYTYAPLTTVAVPAHEWAGLRSDMARAIRALRRVLDGMTVQELAALGDLVEQLEERYGNEVQP